MGSYLVRSLVQWRPQRWRLLRSRGTTAISLGEQVRMLMRRRQLLGPAIHPPHRPTPPTHTPFASFLCESSTSRRLPRSPARWEITEGTAAYFVFKFDLISASRDVLIGSFFLSLSPPTCGWTWRRNKRERARRMSGLIVFLPHSELTTGWGIFSCCASSFLVSHHPPTPFLLSLP